jgi:hypothetical protein
LRSAVALSSRSRRSCLVSSPRHCPTLRTPPVSDEEGFRRELTMLTVLTQKPLQPQLECFGGAHRCHSA